MQTDRVGPPPPKGLPAEERMKLIEEVYQTVVAWTMSFEHDDMIGPDLAYLMGSLVKSTYCSWPASRPIVQLLQGNFAPQHLVWRFIEIEPEEEPEEES